MKKKVSKENFLAFGLCVAIFFSGLLKKKVSKENFKAWVCALPYSLAVF